MISPMAVCHIVCLCKFDTVLNLLDFTVAKTCNVGGVLRMFSLITKNDKNSIVIKEALDLYCDLLRLCTLALQ